MGDRASCIFGPGSVQFGIGSDAYDWGGKSVKVLVGAMDRSFEVLEWVSDYIEKYGVSPTLREISSGLGYGSTSMVRRYVETLVDCGFVAYVPRIARSIKVLGLATPEVCGAEVPQREPTELQRKTLNWIEAFIANNGFSPTVREIMDGCGCSSPSQIQSRLGGLSRRGLIRWFPGKARSIVSVRLSA